MFLVFSTWTITGLFLDGWAHNQGKPETFFTPWHGLLYSGFVAGMAWTALEVVRQRRAGLAVTPPDRLTTGAGILFAASGVGDMLWHLAFGIEEDVEALLSPTHLLLMLAGMLLVTRPLRSPVVRGEAGSLRAAAPSVVAIALTSALAAFFLMFSSPFLDNMPDVEGVESYQAVGLLVTNALLIGPLVWLAARRSLPVGAATMHLTIVATLVSGLQGFDRWPLAVAAIAGGIAGDVVLARNARRGRRSFDGVGLRTLAVATSVAMWLVYFAAYEMAYGLDRPVELWTGPVVFAALTAYALAQLATVNDRDVTVAVV